MNRAAVAAALGSAVTVRTSVVLSRLGRALALLHRTPTPSFGLARANYLATLPQDNTAEPDWPTFYVERRLRPLCTRARLRLVP